MRLKLVPDILFPDKQIRKMVKYGGIIKNYYHIFHLKKNDMKIFKSNIPWLLLLVVLISSCEKTEINYEPNRKTIVKIKDAENEITQKARDVLPTIDEFILLDVRRELTRPDDINQPLTVKLQQDNSLIADYNSAHGTSILVLPSAWFTLSDDITNLTFAPGEVVKTVTIKLNKTSMDLSQRYALAYKITDAGSGAVISSSLKEAIYEIGVKNKWDGAYRITGTMVDLAAPTITGYYPQDADLITTGPASCVMVPWDLGIPGHLILSGTSLSYYGSFGLVLNFDAATNKIASVVNYYGQPAGNTRSAVLDDTGLNTWNPSNKEINIKYFMLQPNTVTTPPYIRTKFDEKWSYLGVR
jgi:hypothetical protein